MISIFIQKEVGKRYLFDIITFNNIIYVYILILELEIFEIPNTFLISYYSPTPY